MEQLFRKTILVALIAALGLATLPFISASAAGEYDPTVPTATNLGEKALGAPAPYLRTDGTCR